jgi:prolipoprotein diacylglyceryltransferase
MVIAIAITIFLYLYLDKKSNKGHGNRLIQLVLIYSVILIGFLSGRLTSLIEFHLGTKSAPAISRLFVEYVNWEGSRWYGALLAGWLFLALSIYLLNRNKTTIHPAFLPNICISSSLGLAIAKWGCFLDGHQGCGGVQTSLPWGVKYEWGTAISHVPLHPVQIYDSIIYFLLFALLLLLRKNKSGWITETYLCYIACYNLVVENIIKNEVMFFNGYLSLGQIVYLIILLLVSLQLALRYFFNRSGQHENRYKI